MERKPQDVEAQEQLKWYIDLRWLLAATLPIIAWTVKGIGEFTYSLTHIFVLAAAIAAYNSVFFWKARQLKKKQALDVPKVKIIIAVQLFLDLAATTILVYLTGGIHSVFVIFYVLHMITPSVLLSTRASWFYAILAVFLYGSLVLLEGSGIIPHLHPLTGAATTQDIYPRYILAAIATLVAALGFSFYLSTTVANKLKRKFSRLLALSEIEKAASSMTEVVPFLGSLLDTVLPLFKAQSGAALLAEDDGSIKVIAARGECGEREGMYLPKTGLKCCEIASKEAIEQKKVVISENVPQETVALNKVSDLEEIGGYKRISVVSVPLRIRKEVKGALTVIADKPRHFSSGEVDFLVTIVERSESAIDRACVYDDLKDSEEGLRAQYKGIPIPTYTWQRVGDDFVLVDYNDAAVTETQGKIVNLVGKRASELYKDTPKILEEMLHCYTERIPLRSEMQYQFRSVDKARYVNATYAFVPPDLVMVHAEDITERKKAEYELKESELHYRALIGGLNQAVLKVRKREITWCSPQIETLFGYKPEELIGQSTATLFPSRDAWKTYGKELYPALKKNGYHTAELKARRKDGKIFNIECSTSVIQEWEIKPPELVVVIKDISDRKKVEEKIKQKTEDLFLINSLNNAINRGKSFEEVMVQLSEMTQKVFSCSGVTTYLLSSDKKYLKMEGSTLPSPLVKKVEEIIGRKIPEVKILLNSGSLYKSVLESGNPRIINDPAVIQSLMTECTQSKILKKLIPKIYQASNMKSVIMIPVISGGEVLGVVDASRSKPFTGSDSERFKVISEQFAIALRRKLIEDAKEASEKRFHTFFENEPEYCYMISLEGKIMDVNRAALKVLGYKKNELVGKTLESIYAPEALPKAKNLFKKWKKTGKLKDEELMIIGKKGERRTVLLSANTVRDIDSNVLHSISIQRDITKRKKAEEKIKESERKYRELVELAPEGIVSVDTKGIITSCNIAGIEMSGYSKDEMVGKHFTKVGFYHAKDKPGLLKIFNSVLRGKAPEPIEIECVRKDGTSFWVEAHAGLLKKDSKIRGAQLVIIDITQRKKAEAEKGIAIHDLGKRMKELSCLYSLSEMARQNLSIDEVCKLMVRMIPSGWQYPEITCARIVYEDKEYESENFKEAKRKEKADIYISGKKKGFVEVGCLEERPFLKEERDLLDAIAERLSRIAERKQVEEGEKRRKRERKALYSIASSANKSLDLDRVLRDSLSHAMKAVDVELGEIYLVEGENLVLRMSEGATQTSSKEVKKIPLSKWTEKTQVVSERLDDGMKRLIKDENHWGKGIGLEGKKKDIQSYISIPLQSKQEPLGLMMLASRKYAKFDTETVKLLEAMGHEISVGIANAKLLREAQDRAAELLTLYEVGKAVDSTLEFNKMLDISLNSILTLFGAESGSIMLTAADGERLEIKVSKGLDKKSAMKAKVKVGEGIAGWVAQTGEPLLLMNPIHDPRFSKLRIDRGIRDALSVPLVAKDKVIGVFNVSNKSSGSFTNNDLSLLCALASEIAVAIENAKLYENLKQGYLSTVGALAKAVDAKDPYTAGHSERVSQIAVCIAREMGLSQETIDAIETAAALHDIGKIGISESILLKPGELTIKEWEKVRKHPEIGIDILQPVEFSEEVVLSIHQHHEQPDGQGYPNGLRGKQICQGAHVLRVADVYEAMTSDRPYRKAYSHQDAIAEIKRYAGAHFDRRAVAALVKVVKETPSKLRLISS